ncbi:hypothetical protein, partial [Providencia stuartii]|uniref:hypothetical protein n=1 Tax=Providencia stuartii TaxID=588 RepID=UPI00017456DC
LSSFATAGKRRDRRLRGYLLQALFNSSDKEWPAQVPVLTIHWAEELNIAWRNWPPACRSSALPCDHF